MDEKGLTVRDNNQGMALPDEQTFRRDIQAVKKFQDIVHSCMVQGHDYGVIPGTGNKPTLLKPGAEKIAKLLGLADTYEILDRQEIWDKGFFRFLVKCKLVSVRAGTVISEGLGECNSMESKYRYRWVGERDLPAGTDTSKLVSQERRTKTGSHWTVYRLENEDIYSQVNTLLKMAKKRALVDASLSAGRLSDVFTQDVEDMTEKAIEDAPEPTTKQTTRQSVDKLSKELSDKIISTAMSKWDMTKDAALPVILTKVQNRYGCSGKDLTKTQATEFLEGIENGLIQP
jgi:hypothetical protein